MAGGICGNSLADIKRWWEEVGQSTRSHSSHTVCCGVHCSLMRGLWSERLRWFQSAWDIWWCWYGSLRYVHVVGNVFVCTCVCAVSDCFPICFLCVFSRDERGLCSYVCWQEVRHSCTRPQLVSVRILCSFASTHLCLVFLSLIPFVLFLGIGGVCFYFICLISSFTSSFSSCSCPASSLAGSVTEGKSCIQPPHCVPFDPAFLPILHQTPKGRRQALFAFDPATN